ncbi:MAG: NUDIX domain-containing protein [Anaerolineae bacterium]|nr:NUDIX domain-containing protein [Anaerolineae bacterium]
MSHEQPIVITAGPRFRRFATSALAAQAIIINQAQQVLLLFSPRKQSWQVVSGALEAGETLLDGTLREVYEELGNAIRVRPLGTVHMETFHYDEQVHYMLSSYYLFEYQGGAIVPGDDMIGSEYRWWRMTDIDAAGIDFHPTTKPWILKRAVQLYELWQTEPNLPLQETL